MLSRPRWAPMGPFIAGAATLAEAGAGALSDRPAPRSATAASEAGVPSRAAPEALPAQWFHDHVDRLWRVVARLGVPRHGIEDIVQEAFIIASRRQADIAPGQERAFLVGTAVRLCSNYRQRAHVRREVSQGGDFEREASAEPDAEQLLIEKRSRELLDRALGELSEEQRAAFVLFELEGHSVPEIARLLAVPVGTASARVWRARSKFLEIATALAGRRELEMP
jgi:RNA polymerase sigma-70 factor (ECF subfamily)